VEGRALRGSPLSARAPPDGSRALPPRGGCGEATAPPEGEPRSSRRRPGDARDRARARGCLPAGGRARRGLPPRSTTRAARPSTRTRPRAASRSDAAHEAGSWCSTSAQVVAGLGPVVAGSSHPLSWDGGCRLLPVRLVCGAPGVSSACMVTSPSATSSPSCSTSSAEGPRAGAAARSFSGARLGPCAVEAAPRPGRSWHLVTVAGRARAARQPPGQVGARVDQPVSMPEEPPEPSGGGSLEEPSEASDDGSGQLSISHASPAFSL
jgi:hypothetical protein